MSALIIPQDELEQILAQLDNLGLGQLQTFVTTARAQVELRAQVNLSSGGTAREQVRDDAKLLNSLTSKRAALDAWLEVVALQFDEGARGSIDDARRKARIVGKTPPVGAVAIPERIILEDEMVAFDWLERARQAAAAIAWVRVPRFADGDRDAGQAYGTALLLDPTHILTCLHVFKARDPDEAKPSARDLDLQIRHSEVAFNFTSGKQPVSTINVAREVAVNEDLDYAVVELDAKVKASAPPLWIGDLPDVDGERAFVVNILQHPRGEYKQLAMRNNAVALIEDDKIGYWTDTDQGSSGAPVFNDDWHVIAVHRAYEKRKGLQYLGRSVGGANIGTRITHIVDDLRTQKKAKQLVKRLNVINK